jgi:hypothetical protein
MLRLNLLLVQKAPLEYFREVVWAFGTYWFPSATTLANFNSRTLQFLWGVLHFLLIGGFAFNLIILVGAACLIRKSMEFIKLRSSALGSKLRLIDSQALMYGLAGTIVIYTAAISCLVEGGDPRYRVPTDSLIVFMLFLGTHLWRHLIDLSRAVTAEFQRNFA